MQGLTHFSVVLALGAGTLSGCFKKKPKGAEETYVPAPAESSGESANLASLTGNEPQRKLAIQDPLKALTSMGTWRPMRRDGAPLPCPHDTRTFWTGNGLLVFGQLKTHTPGPICTSTASLWDPLTDSWHTLAPDGASPGAGPEVAGAEVFLVASQLYVILPKALDSRVLDLTTQTWKPSPAWISQVIWPVRDDADTKDAKSVELQSEMLTTPRPHPYIPSEAGLAVWTDTGLKIFDWASGAGKDMPQIPWGKASPSGTMSEWETPTLVGSAHEKLISVYVKGDEGSPNKTTLTSFAITSLLGAPPTWSIVTPPQLVDDQGKPKCGDTLEAFASFVDSKLVLVSMDNSQDEPKPLRTCFSALDSQTGVMTHTAYLTLSQIAGRSDGSYEYLDQSIRTSTQAGRRMVYRLKRDGGLVSISDDASQGFAFEGHDERFLVYDIPTGNLAVTPPWIGSGEYDQIYMVGTDRGLVVWGGHKPKADGNEESFSDGMIIDWP